MSTFVRSFVRLFVVDWSGLVSFFWVHHIQTYSYTHANTNRIWSVWIDLLSIESNIGHVLARTYNRLCSCANLIVQSAYGLQCYFNDCVRPFVMTRHSRLGNTIRTTLVPFKCLLLVCCPVINHQNRIMLCTIRRAIRGTTPNGQ